MLRQHDLLDALHPEWQGLAPRPWLMPELPEIEVLRRSLLPTLIGRRIKGIEVREPRLRWPVETQALQALKSHNVLGLRRRSKYLLIDLEGERVLMIHLGMSGQLFWADAKRPKDHQHIVFHTDTEPLVFRDPRRFGSVHAFARQDEANHPRLRDLGPEPLEHPALGEHLWQQSRGRKVAVKSLIMDAKQVVGVGNIYANEALFGAGIDPRRASGRIAKERYIKLGAEVIAVLSKAIEVGGTSFQDFLDSNYIRGSNQNFLRVYDRAGQPCSSCEAPLRMIQLGGRATYFCAKCQR